jgi:hypothetical protein
MSSICLSVRCLNFGIGNGNFFIDFLTVCIVAI